MKSWDFVDIETSQAMSNKISTMMTFADLMMLLLCFFILLYSVSEINKQKFSEIGQSIQIAFGQNNSLNINLEDKNILFNNLDHINLLNTPTNPLKNNLINNEGNKKAEMDKEKYQYTSKTNEILQYYMAEETSKNLMQIEQKEGKILISLAMHQAFESGSAQLTPEIRTSLKKLSKYLNGLPGNIIVIGHTDNIPIINSMYPSNWELASARAATVIREFIKENHLEEFRFHLEAYADQKPMVNNDTKENREKNRRIEIWLDQSAYYEKDQPLN